MYVLQKMWIVNVIRIGMKRMGKCRKLRQKYNEYNNKIKSNSKNMCEDCDKGNRISVCVCIIMIRTKKKKIVMK